jgi:S-formylglutathione hydrolase FrmB
MTAARLHDPGAFQGSLAIRVLESELLARNPLGDPTAREVSVWSPPGASAGLPALLVLAGFTGRGQKYLDTHPWHPGLALRIDRAFAEGRFPACHVVFPDCFTALGGSQYLDSSAVGPYQSHLLDELLPFVKEHWGVSAVGVVGKSSGGFGALRLAMARPGAFRVAGSLSGDLGFDLAYGGELMAACRGLVPHGGDAARFLEEFRREPSLSGDGHAVIDVLAMSACYAPDPSQSLGFELPMDPHTGERTRGWERWLENDPLRRLEAEGGGEGLRSLELLDLRAGTQDEFHLQFGLRRFVRRLAELGIPHSHAEFEGGHFGTDGELLDQARTLAERLCGGAAGEPRDGA